MRSRWIRLLLISLPAALLLTGCRVHARAAAGWDLGIPVFIVDPGHGGEDGGAVSADGLKESAVNLAVCRRLDAFLGLLGCDSVMTRGTEELAYPPEADTVRRRKQADLDRRIAMVNGTARAVLVSVHQNKYPDSAPKGAQVFYRDDALSRSFAETLTAVLQADLGSAVRPAAQIPDTIYLLRKIDAPGILIECGFLSNPQELQLLRSEGYQTRLALCIACACAAFANELENGYGKG